MEKKRKVRFIVLFSVYTAANIFLVCKVNGSEEVRDSWREVYIRRFHWWDILVFAALLVFVCFMARGFTGKVVPRLRALSARYAVQASGDMRGFTGRTFLGIFAAWFVFFLAFYPGTAMNDTIYILKAPLELGNQHPFLYNMYLYAFYRIGCLLQNPNLGLAILSLVQMVGMAYVLARAVTMLRRRGAAVWLCRALTVYFGIAPLFPTYAVSAIKDTPFSVCLFGLLLLLYELASGKGAPLASKAFLLQLLLCMCGVAMFRNNGAIIVLGTAVVLGFCYRRYMGRILLISGGVLVVWITGNRLAAYTGIEPLFQERAAIPLQQTAAVIVKGGPLDDSEAQYLYRLLPEKSWQEYSPACSDTIKWNDAFDRAYLNQTKDRFMQIWGQLLCKNPKVCMEAYLLETYGIWGIETRNKEQYYNKEIWENTLGLYQDSPLPEPARRLIVDYYCNRFTYRYLSMGTAYWLLFAVTLWLLYQRAYHFAVVTLPLWLLFVGLLAATPIAFAFRYGFVVALAVPFYVILPFMGSTEGSCVYG